MKKRAIQILLALSLIFYKSTWFWRVFNHLAKPYLPASREFFQILLLMESGVLFLAVIYLLVFAGKKIFHFKWQLRYFIYLLLGYIISYMSDFLFSYFISLSSNQISLNETVEMMGRQEFPYSCSSFASSPLLLRNWFIEVCLWQPFSKTHLGTEMFCFLLLFSVIFISILL